MTDQAPNPSFWLVIDKRGNPSAPQRTYRLAELKRQQWDLEFPTLAPHRAMLYQAVLVPGEENANADPAIPEKAA